MAIKTFALCALRRDFKTQWPTYAQRSGDNENLCVWTG